MEHGGLFPPEGTVGAEVPGNHEGNGGYPPLVEFGSCDGEHGRVTVVERQKHRSAWESGAVADVLDDLVQRHERSHATEIVELSLEHRGVLDAVVGEYSQLVCGTS